MFPCVQSREEFIEKAEYFLNELKHEETASKILEEVMESYEGFGRYKNKFYKGRTITTPLDFIRLTNKIKKLDEFAFDTEFTSLMMMGKNPGWDFVACSFSWGSEHNYYIPVGHLENDSSYNIPLGLFKTKMRKIFERENYRLIGHNLKAEIHALAQIDVRVLTDDLFDTQVMMWTLEENKHSNLKDCTKRHYNYEQTEFKKLLRTIIPEVVERRNAKLLGDRTIAMVDIDISSFYALDDTYFTWSLYLDFHDRLIEEQADGFFFKRAMPYIPVLVNMERRGVNVDRKALDRMHVKAKEVLDDLEYRMFEIAGIKINVNSDQQLAELLFGWEKYKPIFKQEEIPELDSNGNQLYYKSGPRKGQPKIKYKNTKEVIGEEFCGNEEILDMNFGYSYKEVTAKGQPKIGKEVLAEILAKKPKGKKQKEGHEFVTLLSRYSRLNKLYTTYIDGMYKNIYPDGKVRPSFNNTGTTSGRLSCNNPNLQNLPRPLEEPGEEPVLENYPSYEDYEKAYSAWEYEKSEYDFWIQFEIRSIFVAPKGKKLVAGDWSNLEMRVLTHFSQDELLINMFKTGVDAHGDTAKNMFKLDCSVKDVKKLYPHLRQQAKTINFLLVYGGGPQALAQSIPGVDKKEGQQLYDLYFETYKGVSNFIRRQKKLAKRDGIVKTLLGRTRHLQDFVWAKDWGNKGYGERLAINSPIQGSAADIAISCQIIVENDEVLRELEYEQLLQVHDEIVGSCPEENVKAVEERIAYLMANCLPQEMNNIKLEASVDNGYTYAEAK